MKSKKPYTQTATLLDPDNVVPSWESGGVENREISMRMREQRQEYDRVHRIVAAKERELEKLKKRLDLQKNEEFHVEESKMSKERGIAQSDAALSQIKEAHDFEQMNQRQYKHMIHRMQ